MVANQAFHGALEDGAYLDAHFLCGLGKYLLIMECYGADEMYLAMLIIVMYDVPFQALKLFSTSVRTQGSSRF